ATLAANVQMHRQRLEELHNHPFQDLDGSLIYIGQTPDDASRLAPDGRSLRCADFADRLRALSEGRRLLYKGHTFALDFASTECTELARITGQPVTACQQNAYQILSTHDDVELVGISSGLLQEAAWFGKKAHMLFQPFVPLAERELSADTYQQVHFRTFLSPGFWHQVLTPQCPAPRLPTLPDVTYNHARETLNLWWDYSKVLTWERQLPYESFLRGGGAAMQQRIEELESQVDRATHSNTKGA
ncbi:MAG: hypothetical protein RBS27_06300, partial [Giesbergeria sp.]|nr:hypothetical protein [Giesbergeria sp.]